MHNRMVSRTALALSAAGLLALSACREILGIEPGRQRLDAGLLAVQPADGGPEADGGGGYEPASRWADAGSVLDGGAAELGDAGRAGTDVADAAANAVVGGGEGGNAPQAGAGAAGGNAQAGAGAEAGTDESAAGSSSDAGQPSDPCLGVVCQDPPSAQCRDANTLRGYESVGSCKDGDCSYVSSETTCDYGCKQGACTPDPCIGVTCDSPRANFCQDTGHLVAYDSQGTCKDGSCSYGSKTFECNCSAGACQSDPCASVVCNTPPDPLCTTATQRRSYTATGSCSGGSCSYDHSDETCAYGCSNGACNPDPCAHVSCTMPPAAACLDGSTLRSYEPVGSCSGGSCSYDYSDADCPSNQQCKAGACSVCVSDSACGSACAACAGGTPKCKSLGGSSQCVQCVSDSDCGGATPHCSGDNQCVQCAANGDCKYDACSGGSCMFSLHGFSAPGSSSANRFADRLYCGRVRISSAGTLAALGLRTVTGGVGLRLALYSDSSGAPLNRLAQTAEFSSVANGASEARVTGVSVGSNWYWECLLASETVRINVEGSVTQAFAVGSFAYGPYPAVAPVLTAVSPDPPASDMYIVTTPP